MAKQSADACERERVINIRCARRLCALHNDIEIGLRTMSLATMQAHAN
jgi:hypothetical protein